MPSEPVPLYLVFDGSALDGLLHRIVGCCPPTLEDFRSYEVLGRPYNHRDYFRGIGVSMHLTRKRAVGIARHFDVGRGVAEVDLRGSPIAWARTGGRDHVTVWAPPELLLRAVVQCDDHE